MPPRLSHKKTRSGCQRCKARKVKCDEAKPSCMACARHHAPCEYLGMTTRNTEQQALPTPPDETPTHVVSSLEAGALLDHTLELRLMHEWTAYASKTFSTVWEFWTYRAPLIALEYRHAMDGILALAALHSSRRSPRQWTPTESRLIATRDPTYRVEDKGQDLADRWKLDPAMLAVGNDVPSSDAADQSLIAAKRSLEMLTVSRHYLDRAIDGHRKALANLTVDNIEGVYVTSVLVSFNALFALGEDENSSTLTSLDPILWLHLGGGTRMICERWRELIGEAWITASGVFYGKPDLSNNEELFAPENAKPFQQLLTCAQEYESLTDEDQDTYAKALSYIGLIYKGIHDGSDHPLATCRRLIAMPSRLPPHFTTLAERRQPRAMAMLAHVFACMKLLDNEVMWFKGVAERQVPRIERSLPPGWKEMLKWPMAVARGETKAVE